MTLFSKLYLFLKNNNPLKTPFTKVYIYSFLVVQTFIRLSLFIYEWDDAKWFGQKRIFRHVDDVGMIGFLFDLCVLTYILFIPILYILFLPRTWRGTRFDQRCRFSFLFLFFFILIFVGISEWIFWIEFRARFNFIAVDYLIYTHEVIGNIKESYPLYLILAGITVSSLCFAYIFRQKDIQISSKPIFVGTYLILFAIFNLICGYKDLDRFKNAISREIAQNGYYSFFYALKTSNIPFSQFYLTVPNPDLIVKRTFISSKNPKPYNVIMIVMESMSAEFMEYFKNSENITPNLDRLVRESIFFERLYATGTRTVRGLEALTLGIPPSPGDSIIKKPNNANLYSIGSIFKKYGYRNVFLYGGYGYFDNMNTFFSGNGFDIVDRSKIQHVTFANIWGVCDEDLFDEVLLQANKKSPFFFVVMTTSNHRPYTYPEGKIDLPPKKSLRKGGIKYADYAIGDFLKKAKQKPWFDKTLFVIVSDHTAGSAGKVELTFEKHHIPAFIYAPKILPPQKISQIASQIDLVPTILSILGFERNFIGKDLLNETANRAFISNYQKYGLFADNKLTIIKPVKSFSVYDHETLVLNDISNLTKTIAYYQWSSEWEKRLRH